MIKEQDQNLLEAEFYSKQFYFSYSGLNTLLDSPVVFYKEYVLKQKEDGIKKYLLEGTLIHYLLLENHGFDDKFVVLPGTLPSENNMLIADRIFNEFYPVRGDTSLELQDFEQDIDDILKEINLHQAVKDRDKRLAKVIDDRTKEYFKFLKTKQDKTLIDSAILDKATHRADIAKSNHHIRKLLGMDLNPDGKTIGVYNELELSIEPSELGLPFGFHGTLDNMVVDVNTKTVYINDFKTTSKKLKDFQESVDLWNYWLQAVMYITLVRKFLSKVMTDEWKIEFRFVVFDKYDQVYAFPVSDETLAIWFVNFETVKLEAKYHYESKDFSLPFAFVMGNVKL